jgi:DNA-binding LacI/PurR family transcriptional regulator
MTRPRSLRIAFLVDNLKTDYPTDLVAGVLRAARSMRAHALVIPGGWITRSPEPPVSENFVYEWLQPKRFDGLVVAAGSLSNHCGTERLIEWLGRFGDLPSVAIGVDLPNRPSVYVDNESGVHALVKHLIEQHGRRRIAFIGGPSTSSEAQARAQGYRRALAEAGIGENPRLMLVAPSIGRADGMLAVGKLLDERHFSPETLDAIVCMNDEIALGALDALNRRGLSVPRAIAVAGFDDSAAARSANPPLCTVSQQASLQAETATRALIQALEQGVAPVGARLESAAVIRSSCGCVTRSQNDSAVLPPANVRLAKTCRLALLERRNTVTAELARAAAGRLTGLPNWESRLLDALLQDLENGAEMMFGAQIEQQVRQYASRGNDPLVFHDILTALRLQVLICSAVEPASRPRVEDLFQEARLTLSRIGVEVERTRYGNLSLRLRILWSACLSLLGAGTFAQVAELLEEHLPALGIHTFCVTRLLENGAPGRELEVLVRRSSKSRGRVDRLGRDDLGLDPVLEEEEAMVVQPLCFNGRPVGVAAFSWGAEDPSHYSQLGEMLGAAVSATRRDSTELR